MSDPAGTFNDGGIKLIQQTVTLLDSSDVSTVYILKTGSLEYGVKRTTSTNEFDVERSQLLTDQIPTGSITLQYVNPADKPPKRKQYFTADAGDGTINLLLGKVGRKFGAGEEFMSDCEIMLKMGS